MTKIPYEYRFDQITLGMKAKFAIQTDEKVVGEFAKISGDHNPLHMDGKYASTTNFKKRICHGMLLASFFSRLVGMYLPGKNSLYFSQTLNFQAPCFIGETITIEGEVIDKSESTKIVTIKTVACDSLGKCLVDGIAKVIVRDTSLIE